VNDDSYDPTCQYGICDAEASVAVQPLSARYEPNPIKLCDAHIADWGIHWRDGHSEVVDTL